MSSMEPPPALKLPVELLYRIVDYFDPDDPSDHQALLQCALVAKVLQHYCQRILFDFVEIPYDIYPMGTDWFMPWTATDTPESLRFLCAITESPVLATYIRALKIRLDPVSLDMSNLYLYDISAFESNLPTISSLINTLDTFILSCPRKLGWMKLHDPIQDSIFALLRQNDLKELNFIEIRDVPLRLFHLSPNLERLYVSSVTNNTKGVQPTGVPPRSIPLVALEAQARHGHSLGLDGLEDYLTCPSMPISLSELKKLGLHANYYKDNIVSSILSLCAGSVADLELDFRYPTPGRHVPYSEAVSPDLSSFSKLRRLHLIAYLDTSYRETADGITQRTISHIPWIIGILKTLPALEKRLSLTLQFNCSNLSLQTVDEIGPSLGDLMGIVRGPEKKFWRPNVNFFFQDYGIPSSIAESQPNLAEEVQNKLKERIQDVPLNLFCLSQRLKTLCIADLPHQAMQIGHMTTQSPEIPLQPPQSIPLQSLTATASELKALESAVNFLQDPKAFVDLSKLQHLNIESPYDPQRLTAILRLCCNTLTHLSLSILSEGPPGSVDTPINLSQYINITDMQFNVILGLLITLAIGALAAPSPAPEDQTQVAQLEDQNTSLDAKHGGKKWAGKGVAVAGGRAGGRKRKGPAKPGNDSDSDSSDSDSDSDSDSSDSDSDDEKKPKGVKKAKGMRKGKGNLKKKVGVAVVKGAGPAGKN
ncbi:hypothetical protein CVT24_009680 [Panaeolus cyanescens]|uniref:Uncharacterized protein n=1 Tax=Panaeolus cyanescens TaxID=181874 RepID=A0A409Y9U8_9AGAR|nr:hypothetical protein CVT24_009680 [Panaeolus cyanescens]